MDTTCLALSSSDVLAALRQGVDPRAAILSVLARKSLIGYTLSELSFKNEALSLGESREKLQTLIPPDVLSAAGRVAEESRQSILRAAHDQLRIVSKFVYSGEGTESGNIDAVEQLIQDGRVDLFMP